MGHLSPWDALFLLAPLPRAERRHLAHCLTCEACRSLLREVLARQTRVPGEAPVHRISPADYSAMWAALEERLAADAPEIAREREAAEADLAALLRLPRDRRTVAPRPSVALALLVLERGDALTATDPRESEHLARVAIAIVARLDVQRVPVTLLAELNSQAWTLIGNARRHRRDLTGADWAFAQAQSRLDLATDLLVNATFCRLLAELRREQGRGEEARALRDRALALFRRAGRLTEPDSAGGMEPRGDSEET